MGTQEKEHVLQLSLISWVGSGPSGHSLVPTGPARGREVLASAIMGQSGAKRVRPGMQLSQGPTERGSEKARDARERDRGPTREAGRVGTEQ